MAITGNQLNDLTSFWRDTWWRRARRGWTGPPPPGPVCWTHAPPRKPSYPDSGFPSSTNNMSTCLESGILSSGFLKLFSALYVNDLNVPEGVCETSSSNFWENLVHLTVLSMKCSLFSLPIKIKRRICELSCFIYIISTVQRWSVMILFIDTHLLRLVRYNFVDSLWLVCCLRSVLLPLTQLCPTFPA